MRRTILILGGPFGLIALCWVISGGLSLHQLLDQEGTESFSAAHGPAGVLGCIAFLVLAGLGALGLIYHSVRGFRRAARRT